jgi:cytidylate kinase
MDDTILITIGRQIGSGGLQVAKLVAAELGIDVYDKNLLMLTAKESGLAPEVFDASDEKPGALGRFARLLGIRGSVYSDSQMFSERSVMSEDELFSLQSSMIREIAAKGSGVFVGRAADYVLREHPRMMSVFITADLQDRISRVAERRGISDVEAERFIAEAERKRSNYYNYYTFKKWGDSASYDICLNSSLLGIEATAALIVQIYRQCRG